MLRILPVRIGSVGFYETVDVLAGSIINRWYITVKLITNKNW